MKFNLFCAPVHLVLCQEPNVQICILRRVNPLAAPLVLAQVFGVAAVAAARNLFFLVVVVVLWGRLGVAAVGIDRGGGGERGGERGRNPGKEVYKVMLNSIDGSAFQF